VSAHVEHGLSSCMHNYDRLCLSKT